MQIAALDPVSDGVCIFWLAEQRGNSAEKKKLPVGKRFMKVEACEQLLNMLVHANSSGRQQLLIKTFFEMT